LINKNMVVGVGTQEELISPLAADYRS